MKVLKKDHLPEQIEYRNSIYKHNIALSGALNYAGRSIEFVEQQLKEQGQKGVVVSVLHKNLKGKLDLHNQPYQPRLAIYTTL